MMAPTAHLHIQRTIRRWGCALLMGSLVAFTAMAQSESTTTPGTSSTPAGTPSQGTPAVVLDDNGIESLLGKEVANASGDKLGRVVDVLVSRDGELRAAVIDFGGFLGVGTRKVAVAWSTLRFSGQGPVLNMTSDELRVTPEYRVGEPVVVVGPSQTKTVQPPPNSNPPPE
ncbi:MAG: PRC-barrel domain-containing protein [Hyphomicrobiaceae bacterium]|nr:PRC-barrel domain-containing protein [Hyphomicrobiaceae bacterium]